MNKRKIYAITLVWVMIFQVVLPSIGHALSGGPSQPEFQSFEPAGTSDMVSLPSGDFTYNIPLMDISGYPLNLSYHSGITADQEATTVGLGWTINPGVINRNIRAIPDDFNGNDDRIKKEFKIKPNRTGGANAGFKNIELFGKNLKFKQLKLGLNMGVFYNSYWGLGYEFGLTPSFNASKKGNGPLTAGMGLSANSQNGANFNANLNYSGIIAGDEKKYLGFGVGLGMSVNSREGLVATTLSGSISDATNYRKASGDKKNGSISAGSNTSARFSYASRSYTPQITMPQNSRSFTISAKTGFAAFGSNTSGYLSGYYSQQQLRSNSSEKAAYGLLYAHNGIGNENALMDFNREKDSPFTDYAINLPIVNAGGDILSISAQGSGGSFQLKRGGVPMFYDAKSTTNSYGGSLGAEFGGGGLLHTGVDLNFNSSNSITKKWDGGVKNRFNFQKSGAPDFEPAYYRAAGEMAVESDENYYKDIGEDRAVRAILDDNSSGANFRVNTLASKLKNADNTTITNSDVVRRNKRERRNEVVSYLTAGEAAVGGLEKAIKSYALNEFVDLQLNVDIKPISRLQAHRKSHHISQMTSLRSDGLRYVYGIPAYNLQQKEVTFNVSGRSVDCTTGKVSYTSDVDDSTNNENGKDNFYNEVTTPAYAHSYLLTAVLGQDYEDQTGNGPTPDDIGSYTKFNYSKITMDAVPYKWRVPIAENTANYNAGLFSDTDDDTGSYVYGEKEIWLIHSIVSKTMVAEFSYSDRDDGFGVKGKSGGVEQLYSKKLDKVILYSRPDRLENGLNATPIKTVHFDYDYELCPGTINSIDVDKGKLRLKELYFTYGHSKKGKLSTYKFSYKNPLARYDMKAYDRWSNYKPNNYNPNCKNPRSGHPIPNDESPYAEQHNSTANANAGTWCLNAIDLPSGGRIEVDYEAKDYAYVQDRPAMEMFKIVGIDEKGKNKLYGFEGLELKHYDRVLFEIDKPITNYFKGFNLDKDYLYLKCYVKVGITDKWEYISLYSKVENIGVINNNLGYVDLKPLETTDKDRTDLLNPIFKYASQFIRQNLPQIAYGQTNIQIDDIARNPLTALVPLASMIGQVTDLFVGFNAKMITLGCAKQIDVKGRSLIRLTTPDGFKYGGGSRVASIKIHDNWGTMTANGASDDFHYGQTYDYTTIDERTGQRISSGVASAEPQIGGDENAYRQPIQVTEERKWAIDNVHFVETPLGETLMDGPSIVHSEIKVQNIDNSDSGVELPYAGHSVMKYYTAKDFPIRFERTDLQRMPKRISPIFSLLKVKLKEHENASQGFAVIKNNMHGQAKAKEVYDGNGTLMSKVEYFYKTKVNNPKALDNEVQVINKDGEVSTKQLGVDFQLFGDTRHSKSTSRSGGVSLNLDGFITLFPIAIPMPWPNYESSENQFRSVSMTKLVHKFGILERVVATDLGSTIATENLAYSEETGEVLLTRTYNEYDDPIYNGTLGAYMFYSGMGQAYKNIGLMVDITVVGNGVFEFNNNIFGLLHEGDEVLLYDEQGTPIRVGWLLNKVRGVSESQLLLIDECGNPLNYSANRVFKFKVIRSGRRNITVGAPFFAITTMENPITNTGVIDYVSFDNKILNASYLEYKGNWQALCALGLTPKDYHCQFRNTNPYLENMKGNWKPSKTWLPLTDRVSTSIATSSTNIREDGYFAPVPPASGSWDFGWLNDLKWTTEVTQFHPNGVELENRDILGRYSTELLGYYDQLVTGVAANSQYTQAAFEGFEDYYYNQALRTNINVETPRHFGSDIFISNITDETYHTGKYALKVASGAISSRYSTESCDNRTGGDKAGQTRQTKSNNYDDSSPNFPLELVNKKAKQPKFNKIKSNTLTLEPYPFDNCNCLQPFNPSPGKYVATIWVKEGDGYGKLNYDRPSLRIKTNSQAFDLKAEGNIIDGWQRIHGTFEIRDADTEVSFNFEAGEETTYFDDLQIYPFDADMKNFVYDDISLKLLSEIDANGYPNFYEYDQSGHLIRMKKATERGIMTIQESRNAQPKQ